MSEEAKVETIEIEDAAPATDAPKLPTKGELKEQGWSASELEAAEKRGMVAEEKPDEEEKPEPPKEEPKAEKPEEKKEEPKVEQKKSALPDFTFKTPEQEKAFMDAFGPGTPQRAMYFRMKNERQQRQAAEAKARELEARIAAIEQGKAQPRQTEVDEDGNEIDPDEKPLTMKQLRELQARAQEEQQKKAEQESQRQSALAEAQRNQEEYVRSMVPDFDEKVQKAAEIIKRFQNGTIDEIIPEGWKQKKLVTMWNQMKYLADRADQVGLDDYNAAFLAYEIGQFHPETEATRAHGPSAEDKDGNSKDPNKANGSLTPDQMKRLEATTQRRASSASIPGGGGKRSISVEDVTESDLVKMSYKERLRFKEKYPDRYAKLLRG